MSPHHFSKLTPKSLSLWAALPMAQTSQVEGRLKMILDTTRSRRALTNHALFAVLMTSAAACAVLAMLRPTVHAQNAAVTHPAVSWRRTLPNGVTVELIGISDFPTTRTGWWTPSGLPLAQPPYDHIDSLREAKWKQGRQFALRITLPSGVAADTVTSSFGSDDGTAGTTTETPFMHRRLLPGFLAVSIQGNTLPSRGAIHGDVAVGPWETWETDAPSPENNGPMGSSGYIEGSSGNILFSVPSEIGGDAAVTVTNTFLNAESRVVAVDITGKVFRNRPAPIAGVGNSQQTTCVFDGLPLKRVKEFRFQGRFYQSVDFKDIALQPAK